ncbi:MAG TPA: tyrosine-type recombinase/integrase [Pyrinomonadaceae bacterium]|nr:tyrosine-type recombinase/integrase [Pyrinomonadaceae bacterium]
MSTENIRAGPAEGARALASAAGEGTEAALQTALQLWAAATTDAGSHCRRDLLRAKQRAVRSFFAHCGRLPGEVGPVEVESWQHELERRGFKPATVYARLSRLSSFYEWAMRDPTLGRLIETNPVRLARPKAPRAYQTESARSLDDEQLKNLLWVVRARAGEGDVVGKRDYALLLFFVTTGMRRQEVIGLRGSDLELRREDFIIKSRVKGGDYVARSVEEPSVREALLDYLRSSGRLNALASERPLWTRHDRAGKPGAPLTSHAFSKNLKRYARAAGIEKIHVHQTRHTFARMVSEETGSLVETQEALGHKNLATTRAYVQRVAVRRDKHSRRIAERLRAGG